MFVSHVAQKIGTYRIQILTLWFHWLFTEAYAYIRDNLGLNNSQVVCASQTLLVLPATLDLHPPTMQLMKYIWARNLKSQDANTKIVVNNPLTTD